MSAFKSTGPVLAGESDNGDQDKKESYSMKKGYEVQERSERRITSPKGP